jgi:uridine kinase
MPHVGKRGWHARPVTAVTPTRLIVLRGNSGSGQSTVARAVRERYGRGCALVEQFHLRRGERVISEEFIA